MLSAKEETSANKPQRTFYESTEGIIFDSRFEGGNMLRVEKISDYSFGIWVASDEELSMTNMASEKRNICWFLFKVSNVPPKQTLKLVIKNLSRITLKILSEGYTPSHRIVKRGTEGKEINASDLSSNFTSDFKFSLWDRISREDFKYKAFGSEVQLFVNFTFEEDYEAVYFAYSPNFSYSDVNKYFQYIENSLKYETNGWLYFFREVITQSPQKNDVELATITSNKGYSKNREEFIDPLLFPNRAKSPLRPLKFEKKRVVLISARAHPGETPSSFIMKGMVDFLLEHKTNPISKFLMDEFVFLIIPTMNPDGMVNGHYRLDAAGYNLNRIFNCFDKLLHPSIYALLKLVEVNVERGRLAAFFDLHAHNSKYGAFLLGNDSSDIEVEAEIKLFPCIMNLISVEFHNAGCKFSCQPPKDSRKKKSQQAASKPDKKLPKSQAPPDDDDDGESGVAKTVIYKLSGCPISYTAEVNYNGGPVNHNILEDRKPLPEKEGEEADAISMNFSQRNFENFGRSLCEALAIRMGLRWEERSGTESTYGLKKINPEELKEILIKEISDQRIKKYLE